MTSLESQMAMASPIQPSWLSSLNSKRPSLLVFPSSKPQYPLNPFKLFSCLNQPNAESSPGNGGSKELPPAVQLAMEKAKEYKQKKKQGTVAPQANNTSGVEKNKGKLSVSSMDFVGLGFADKKEGRSLPAGLVPISDDFNGNLPEVEIIVGDSTNFGTATRKPRGDDSTDDIYKPKVSSWGGFPRPNDISKTYGGGRVIHPGEVLETEEEKAAKEARTRQLVAAYKN